MIKNIRTTLFRKENNFWCPKLTLSLGFVLEAEVLFAKLIWKLHHKNKDKLISSVRVHKNVACVVNLINKSASSLKFILKGIINIFRG